MRVLVVSDTHGRHDLLKKIFSVEPQIDLMLHLGDAEGGYEEIRSIAPCPVEMVAGNMDELSGLPDEKIIELRGYRIWMRHGHLEGVSSKLHRLREAAQAKEVDIVLFGHTHMPYMEAERGITYLNPGSISFPRPLGKTPSYVMMEISEGERISYDRRFITG